MLPSSVMILLFILVIFMPAVCWMSFFRFQDRAEPEPKRTLVKVFIWGIVAAILSVFAEELIISFFFNGSSEQAFDAIDEIMYDSAYRLPSLWVFLVFFIAGPVEELIKFILLKFSVYKKAAFNQIADGAIYGVTLALGFTVIENTFYFFNLYPNMVAEDFVIGTVMRGVATVLVHILSTGIAGLYLGRAKFARKGKLRNVVLGLSIAALIHGMFNVLVLTSNGFIMSAPVLVFGFIVFVSVLKRSDSQIVWRLIKP